MDFVSDKSEFNFALSYLNRLNGIFYSILEARETYDIIRWHNCLLSLHSELSTHMKQDKKQELNKRLYDLLDNVQKQIILNQNTGNTAINKALHLQLKDIEDELRLILKDAGLETKLMEDARKAIK